MKTRSSLLAIVAICFCFIMVVSTANGDFINGSKYVSYSSNGITITMNSEITQISMDNHVFSANWEIFLVGHNGLQIQNFTHYRISRIDNAYQNTAARIQWNSFVKVAQIFSFGKGSVDASVSIENLRNSTSTFEASFVLVSPHVGNADTFGVNPGLVNAPMSYNRTSTTIINSTTWGVDNSLFSLNWGNEATLFHSGLMVSTLSKSEILLPFGPFSLFQNDTFTVDPLLSVNNAATFNVPPSTQSNLATSHLSPDCLACVCTVCGGGGGSGGTGPSGLSISASPIDSTPGTIVDVSGSLSNYGSGGVTFYLYAETSGGSWNYFSSDSSVSFHWSSLYGYKAVQVRASNSYGSTTSNTVSVYVYNYPEANVSSSIFTSNSELIASSTNGITNGAGGLDTTSYVPSDFGNVLYLGTMVYWKSGFNITGISSMSVNVSSDGEYGFSGTPPSRLMEFHDITPENQYAFNDNNQMDALGTYLNGLASSLSYGIIPDFGPYSTQDTNYYNNYYTFSFEGKATALYGPPYVVYSPILNNTGGPAHNLGIDVNSFAIFGNSVTSSWHVFVLYTAQTTLITNYNGGTNAQNTYSITTSLIIQLNVQAS